MEIKDNFAKLKTTTLEKGKLLGQGAYGKVYSIDIQNKKYAIKQIIFKNDKKIKNEISLCKILKHPNITNCVGSVQQQNELFMIFEYATGGDLKNFIDFKGRLSEDETKKIAKNILSALQYCHNLKICHYDLKPENILIFIDGENRIYKLTDWGLSEVNSQTMKEIIKGTPYYMAPELISHKNHYCDKTDLWAFGIMLYYCLEGKPPFESNTIIELSKKIETENIIFKRASKEAQEFILKFLQKDPSKRISAFDALQDKWLKTKSDIEFETIFSKIVDQLIEKENEKNKKIF